MKFWITLNEPRVVATQGYGDGHMAPGIVGPGTTTYVAAHNLIKAHAKAYHIYDEEFRQTQKGIKHVKKTNAQLGSYSV